LLDACEHISIIKKLQERRPEATRPFKLKIPEESLLQLGIYWASEIWEKDQESKHPKKEPAYRPTYDDLLIRYVKTLAWKSMDRHSRVAAVGLGCLLFTYQPHEVSSLAEDHFDSDNIRRDKRWMFEQIKRRFQGAEGLTNGNEQVVLEVPSRHQRELIQQSLSRFAPWCSCSTATTQTRATSLLETYFDKDSKKSEWERVHVIFDPACGGLPRLVREYNSAYSRGNAMRLDDPEDKLGSPKFGDGLHPPMGNGDGGPLDPGERFNPSPLTDSELSSIRHASERNQRRRKNYKSGQLRVYVDGEETITFVHNYLFESFTIPHTASCIQVFGEDDEGELLLAVFPLNYFESGDNALDQKLYVTHDSGQMIELSISAVSGQSRESVERLFQLAYIECVDQVNTGTFDSSHLASSTFPDREDSLNSINPVVNDSPPIRKEHSIQAQPVYLTGWAAVQSDLDAPHRELWAKACEVFSQRLRVYALKLANGRLSDAEDLVQETICRMLTYPRKPTEIRSPSDYLLVLMRNLWIAKRRRENRVNMESLDELLSKEEEQKQHRSAVFAVEPDVLRILENDELKAELRAMLRAIQGSLKPREKLLLALHLEDYSYKEIAYKLNEDMRVVRSDLNAVITKVRSRLKAVKKRTSTGSTNE
jgi:RNA polymerase sigma factor (sigma-70 family)